MALTGSPARASLLTPGGQSSCSPGPLRNNLTKTTHVLVLTNPEDFHAWAISEVFLRKEISHALWFAADFPATQSASVWLRGDQEAWEIEGPELRLSAGEGASTVWLRRPGRPVLPEAVEPEDRLFAYRECRTFLDCLQRLAGAGAFWVNPLEGFVRANLKLEQLRSAARNGFRLPETLLSNDPAEIRRFLQARLGRVIYKAFFPFAWRSQDGLAPVFCTPVTLADLPDDAALSAAPGIYQVRVDKAYELRVTVMGRRLFAVKIHSQDVPSARMDWRAATEPVRLEPFTLPKAVAKACLAVMRDLGIVFGCFDLIVTPAGDYVFLEVNEMGAFLWLEEQIPELSLADAFAEFLCKGRGNRATRRPTVKLADVRDEAVRRMQVAAADHRHVKEPEEIPVENTGREGQPPSVW